MRLQRHLFCGETTISESPLPVCFAYASISSRSPGFTQQTSPPMPSCRYLSRIHAADPVVFAAPSSPNIATDSTAFRNVKASYGDHWNSGKFRSHGSRPWNMEPNVGSWGPEPLLSLKKLPNR